MSPRHPSQAVLPTPELFQSMDDYMLAAYLSTPPTDSHATLGAEICNAISAAIQEHLTIQILAIKQGKLSCECSEMDNSDHFRNTQSDGSDAIVPF